MPLTFSHILSLKGPDSWGLPYYLKAICSYSAEEEALGHSERVPVKPVPDATPLNGHFTPKSKKTVFFSPVELFTDRNWFGVGRLILEVSAMKMSTILTFILRRTKHQKN